MNQLINDLAEHCDFYVGNEHSEETYQEKERLWLEKFAELILLECNMALQPILRDMISRGEACDLINKHFGVE